MRQRSSRNVFSQHLDHEIGSIEVGKQADFAVLAEDPMSTPAKELKNISVLGTVMGGRHFPV